METTAQLLLLLTPVVRCHDWFGKTDVADDKWHHLVATSDGKEHRIYVDGKLDEKVDAPAKVIGAGLPRFGFIGIGSEAGAFDAATGPTWAYGGILDEFMLFHRSERGQTPCQRT